MPAPTSRKPAETHSPRPTHCHPARIPQPTRTSTQPPGTAATLASSSSYAVFSRLSRARLRTIPRPTCPHTKNPRPILYHRLRTHEPACPPLHTIRPATPADIPACAQICFDAFAAISRAHNFPPDIPSPEVAAGFLTFLFSAPGFHCIVAEQDGRILGSNVLDERSIIHGIGPITVDPTTQNRGVGRLLMQAVLDRAASQHAPGVRLVQAAFHNRSLSLYTTLGFDVREPLACMQRATSSGTETAAEIPRTREIPGYTVRPATPDDIPACAALSLAVHGFDRSPELPGHIHQGTARVVLRDGRITAYATALGFFGHSTAETLTDLQALIASADTFLGPGILVPTRNAALFRWCLAQGLRVTQPMTLMSLGLYNNPAGAFLPSVSF